MRIFSLYRSSLPVYVSFSAAVALTATLQVGCGDGATPGPDAPPPSVSGDAPPGEESASDDEAPAGSGSADDAGDEIRRIVNGEGYDLSVERQVPNLRASGADVSMAVPKGWVLPLRKPGYVVWFAEKQGQDFPRILVTAEPAPAESTDTTPGNVLELRREVAGRVTETLESPLAMIVGDVPCVRYVVSGRAPGGAIEEQILETVQGGQLFKVNLQALVSSRGESPLLKYRDKGYAVLASLKVEKSDAAPADASEAPPADASTTEGAAAESPPAES